jgi:hypothetical protein
VSDYGSIAKKPVIGTPIYLTPHFLNNKEYKECFLYLMDMCFKYISKRTRYPAIGDSELKAFINSKKMQMALFSKEYNSRYYNSNIYEKCDLYAVGAMILVLLSMRKVNIKDVSTLYMFLQLVDALMFFNTNTINSVETLEAKVKELWTQLQQPVVQQVPKPVVQQKPPNAPAKVPIKDQIAKQLPPIKDRQANKLPAQMPPIKPNNTNVLEPLMIKDIDNVYTPWENNTIYDIENIAEVYYPRNTLVETLKKYMNVIRPLNDRFTFTFNGRTMSVYFYQTDLAYITTPTIKNFRDIFDSKSLVINIDQLDEIRRKQEEEEKIKEQKQLDIRDLQFAPTYFIYKGSSQPFYWQQNMEIYPDELVSVHYKFNVLEELKRFVDYTEFDDIVKPSIRFTFPDDDGKTYTFWINKKEQYVYTHYITLQRIKYWNPKTLLFDWNAIRKNSLKNKTVIPVQYLVGLKNNKKNIDVVRQLKAKKVSVKELSNLVCIPFNYNNETSINIKSFSSDSWIARYTDTVLRKPVEVVFGYFGFNEKYRSDIEKVTETEYQLPGEKGLIKVRYEKAVKSQSFNNSKSAFMYETDQKGGK